VFFVNTIGPYLLNSVLKPLLARSKLMPRFIVNVSAMEGQFARFEKTARHPHTNMAKAALNMMTRTSAQEFQEAGIYMNSVDTGWITDENPYPKRARMRKSGFVPPLDEIDGASRIYDPIVRGIRGELLSGFFSKDYAPTPW
jgi:NAD(P)-dependent dehydrogenase (short-subunit alcohol dehydrogenase family)